MKKLLLILLCLPMIGFGQQTNYFRPIPSFSEFQTAKMLGMKNLEIITLTSLIYQPEQSSTSNNATLHQSSAIMPTFGFISVYGLKKKLDVRVRLNFLFPNDDFRYYRGDKYMLYEFSCGAKLNLITNKLALCTDFNIQQQNVPEFAEHGQSTYSRVDFIPTLLYTFSFDNKKSVTLSVKHFQPLHHSSDYTRSAISVPHPIEKVQSFGAINCNMVFNIKDWCLIPEISLLHAYGQNDVASSLSTSPPPSTGPDPVISTPPGDFFITPFYFQIGIGVSKTF